MCCSTLSDYFPGTRRVLHSVHRGEMSLELKENHPGLPIDRALRQLEIFNCSTCILARFTMIGLQGNWVLSCSDKGTNAISKCRTV